MIDNCDNYRIILQVCSVGKEFTEAIKTCIGKMYFMESDRINLSFVWKGLSGKQVILAHEIEENRIGIVFIDEIYDMLSESPLYYLYSGENGVVLVVLINCLPLYMLDSINLYTNLFKYGGSLSVSHPVKSIFPLRILERDGCILELEVGKNSFVTWREYQNGVEIL